jgi:hypothetical protein
VRELERRFERELVVIGVHSGKFRAERITSNIAAAAQRLGVEHPVVNDRQYRVWRAFGVNAWPTLVLIDAAGGIEGVLPGEIQADDLAPAIAELVTEAETAGILDRSPFDVTLPAEPRGPLRFPGRVLALPGGRLFVADSGHDRILEVQVEIDSVRAASAAAAMREASAEATVRPASAGTDPPGDRSAEPRAVARILRVVGSGERGNADGALAEARFDHPQGMALAHGASLEPGAPLAAGSLYVADAENHTVKVVDLAAGRVATLAGTGQQARRFNVPGTGTDAALNSPWDVALVPDGERPQALIVAMAGMHQLWRIDLGTLAVEPWAGTGREDITDGPAFRATLAQTTGLSLAGPRLYFADPESSAVRYAEPATDAQRSPQVTTLVGRGLFEFGDQDGQGGHARLQHPYDLAFHAGVVYVADTYNNRIKRLDPGTRRIATFLGSGEEGQLDGDAATATFDEPQGLAVADDILYVADTNNHALRAADLTSARPRVVTLTIVG